LGLSTASLTFMTFRLAQTSRTRLLRQRTSKS